MAKQHKEGFGPPPSEEGPLGFSDQPQSVFELPRVGAYVRPPREAKPIRSAADLGALIRSHRESQKLSQQAFADLVGVGRRFISELENGKPTLEFDKVLKVASSMGFDLFVKPR